MNPYVRKRTFWHVHPTKIQISLRIRAFRSESSLSAWWNFAFLTIQNPPSANAQADLNFRWAHMFEDTFSDIATQYIVHSLFPHNL